MLLTRCALAFAFLQPCGCKTFCLRLKLPRTGLRTLREACACRRGVCRGLAEDPPLSAEAKCFGSDAEMHQPLSGCTDTVRRRMRLICCCTACVEQRRRVPVRLLVRGSCSRPQMWPSAMLLIRSDPALCRGEEGWCCGKMHVRCRSILVHSASGHGMAARTSWNFWRRPLPKHGQP